VANWRSIVTAHLLASIAATASSASLAFGAGVSALAYGGARQDEPPAGTGFEAPPGPVQGTALPASAAASGFGFSIFLTLAGLLVLGALWAAHRLRLSSELWRLAPVVLIPERPG
jgi:hypothetical protein